MLAVIFGLIILYGFKHFYSYDMHDDIKQFRNKLFSCFLTLIHRLETWTSRHSHCNNL